jgi:hypothetical protein
MKLKTKKQELTGAIQPRVPGNIPKPGSNADNRGRFLFDLNKTIQNSPPLDIDVRLK